MKALTSWLIVALVGFGGFAASYHNYLQSQPRLLLVVVDESDAMRDAWPRLRSELTALAGRRYTRFALATSRDLLHTWSPHLLLGQQRASGPRNLAALQNAPHLPPGPVDEKLLITNAAPDETAHLSGWRVKRL